MQYNLLKQFADFNTAGDQGLESSHAPESMRANTTKRGLDSDAAKRFLSDEQSGEILKLYEQYRNVDELNLKPMHYQVIDGIFHSQLKEVQQALQKDSIRRLKKLNLNIEERLQKGTDMLHGKPSDPIEDMKEKQALVNSRQRVKEIIERVESQYK